MSKKKAITLTITLLVGCFAVLLWILAYLPSYSFWRAMCITDRIEIKGPEIRMNPRIVYPSKKILLTGEEATKAARSLRFEWCVGHPLCASEAQVRFYEGTNLLTEVGMCVHLLLIDGKWYRPNPNGQSLIQSWSDRLRQTD